MPCDVLIRQPTIADGPAIEAMFARCSVESRYARFLAPVPEIPPAHLARVVTPTVDDESWIGVNPHDPDTVVALASWARRGDDAELAVLVEDSWQRHGIGSTLLRILGDRTANAGVCRLTASVLRESKHVVHMLCAVLGPTRIRSDGYVSEVTIDRCA